MTWFTVAPRAALLLLFFSGAAGLAHQVIWTRRLVDILGASADTFSKVVGAFCVGLAIGGAWSALKPAPTFTAWRRVAMAELAVAILALLVLSAIPIAEWWRRGPTAALWLKTLLPVLLVTPPAIAMGLVLPAVLAGTPGSGNAVWAYAVNTLGGVAGIAGVVFIALPVWGLNRSGLIACGTSFGLAIAAWALYRARRTTAAETDTATKVAESRVAAASPRATGVLAFASGFLVLGLEVVAQQQFAQVTINSHFSSGTVLAVVLLALGAASLVIARVKRPPHLSLVLGLAAGAWLLQPSSFLALRPNLQIIAYELPPGAYFVEVVVLAVGTLVPGFVAAGLLFPLLLRGVERPAEIARLLALNGLGGWLGSEATQSFLLPTLGLWRSILVMAAIYLGLLIWQPRRREQDLARGSSGWISWVARLALLLLLGGAWIRAGHSPQVSRVPQERVVELAVGREGVVATVAGETNDWRIVFNNTYTLGGSRAQANQERQAHLPLLLHGRPKSVALLGVATGSTLAGAALHSQLERLDAFELSPLAARFAREHFAPFNRDVFRDPRVTVALEDARWSIAQTPSTYDVVIGDLFLPWRTGEGRLYAQEHFAAIRRSLRPDGLFCQWLPLFQLTRPQFETIARTFQSVFTNSFLLRGDFYTDLPIVGLCAWADGRTLSTVDWTSVAKGCEQLRSSASRVTDPLVRHPEGVAMCVVGAMPAMPPGPVNTLGNAWLEWDAGRTIIGLRLPWFIGVPAAEFLRDALRADSQALPPEFRSAQDAGQFFLTLEIAAKVNAPVLANLRAQIPERLPAPLRHDPAAHWPQWPGRVKPFSSDSGVGSK